MGATPEQLHVISVFFNPTNSKRRYELYRNFEKEMLAAGVVFYAVECIFPGQEFKVTDAGNPQHLQVRAKSYLWHKEALINRGLTLLPDTAEYVAWVDTDVTFSDPGWASKAIEKLQQTPLLQLWESCDHLGPAEEVLSTFYSAAFYMASGRSRQIGSKVPYGKHPGFAWAARKDFLKATNGLLDFGIVGNGDNQMFYAGVGTPDHGAHFKVPRPYKEWSREWSAKAMALTKGTIGYLPVKISHHWHGSMEDRRYWWRWEMMIRSGFDPNRDIRRGENGLWEFTNTPQAIQLEREIRAYFLSRREDN